MPKAKAKVIQWFIWPLTAREARIVHRGPRGAMCRAENLYETAASAACAAERCGAKSWDIIPLVNLGVDNPTVGIKLYNRADFGICTFPPPAKWSKPIKVNGYDIQISLGRPPIDYITGKARGKEHYWFDELPQPHHLDLEKGVYDASHGENWHPELQI